jgi:hypothetical protein
VESKSWKINMDWIDSMHHIESHKAYKPYIQLESHKQTHGFS